MLKEMNPKIFKKHLQYTIGEIVKAEKNSLDKYFFIINPIVEQGKPLLTIDNFMRMNVLNRKAIEGKKFSIDEVINILTFYSPVVPVWIDVKVYDNLKDGVIFQLDVSLRFRKPSQIGNQDTGHPPFRAVIDQS